LRLLRSKVHVQEHRFQLKDGKERKRETKRELWLEEVKRYFVRLTFETLGTIVTNEERLTSAMTQVAVTINDAGLALPVSVAFIAESHVRQSG